MSIEQAVVGEYVRVGSNNGIFYAKILEVREVGNDTILIFTSRMWGRISAKISECEYTGFKNKWQSRGEDELIQDLYDVMEKVKRAQKNEKLIRKEIGKRLLNVK